MEYKKVKSLALTPKILTILLAPTLLMANVVWPALYLEYALITWWVIALGLLVEVVLIKKLFHVTTLHSIKSVLTANIISALLGILLIPIGGIVIEFFPGMIVHYLFKVGTFNPFTWVLTFIIAACINAFVEGFVYKEIFKYELLFKSKKFLFLFLINLLSVSFAIFLLVDEF